MSKVDSLSTVVESVGVTTEMIGTWFVVLTKKPNQSVFSPYAAYDPPSTLDPLKTKPVTP
jgi:hypothetical protein